jgi:low affinity Fe/Cu permease
MAFMNDVFHRFAQRAATAVGSPWAFVIAVLAIVTWAFTGPAVGFSTTWQLVINTGTTIVTFLIVFLIQNTQNRESQAVQLKLDELISVSTGSNALIDVEGMTDQQATTLLKRFHHLAEKVADQ